MALEGTLDVFRLPEILQLVSMQRKTGILTVQGEQDIVAISFLEGAVVAADALNQTVEEGLGQVLAGQGLVRSEHFSAVAAEHEAGGKRLIDLLLERGLLTHPQLLTALRQQTYLLLAQVLAWDAGEFKFYSGEEVAFEEGFEAIAVEELLVRALADEGGQAMPRLDVVYRRLASSRPIKIFGQDGEGQSDDPSALWLSPDEQGMLSAFDGRRPASSLTTAEAGSEYRVLFALYRLLQGGLVEAVVQELPEPRALPAEPAPLPVERRPRPRPVRKAQLFPAASLASWGCRAVATAVSVLLLAVVLTRPYELFHPFPWQKAERGVYEKARRAAAFLEIDGAARTVFLLQGRYPEGLAELSNMGLLSEGDLLDPLGRPLALMADAASYRLEPVAGGETIPSLGAREGIAGDFLLDPEYLLLPQQTQIPPLVLLD